VLDRRLDAEGQERGRRRRGWGEMRGKVGLRDVVKGVRRAFNADLKFRFRIKLLSK